MQKSTIVFCRKNSPITATPDNETFIITQSIGIAIRAIKNSKRSLFVHNIAGLKEVVDYANNGLSTIQFNTNNYVNGLYFERINTLDGLTYTDKLVK